MALVLKDRVKETSSSSGTGNITLTGAFPGYQTFNTAIASGSTVYYTIHNINPGHDTEWEVGVGTFTAPSTLSRNTVFSSSNSGSLVPFTAGSGGLEVFVTQPAEQALYTNQATGKVEVFGNGTNTIAFTNINASNVVMVSGTISTNAANATDITNKTYVDGLFSTGISYHDPVLVEEDTALNAVYVQPNGAGNGVGATLTNNGANAALVVDGVSVANTARILVYAQANAVQNGVYTVTNPGNATAQWVLTRATDADTFGLANPNTLGQGDAFFVTSGNTGAGRTYICNTTGTITFGSTNITFAQISSAQIYAAGTGLNLANLTFSISNTAVTAGTYGDAGTVGTFTVNAQGQLTAASNAAINASSITLGTLGNARTTASASNGANTIVSRDANGSFTANVVTATTVNATTGNFTNITANASGLTDINASNITSGTISNARTTGNTANSASTIVLRDASGNFGANTISGAFSGDGSAINAINASNISSGTIANSRTTAASANGASTIVLRDAGGNFVANTITANISGDISGGTNINASNITSGTINNARTTASSANGASTIVLRDVNGSFDANVVNATNLSGGGTSITSMNASNLSAGTVASARISGAYGNITGVGTVTSGTWQGNVIATTYGGTNLSSFTANGVVYASSTTALATGSGFVFDGTNVGIGTSSPASYNASGDNLVIYGAGNSGITIAGGTTDIGSLFFADGTTGDSTFRGFLQYLHGSDAMVYGTSGTERMRITSSGDVGIGTSSPAARLQVNAPSTTAASLTFGATAGQILRNENSELAIGLSSSSPFPLYMQGRTSTNTARDIVLNPLGGGIGIGKNPSTALDVNGTVTATTFSGAGTNLTGTASSLTVGTATNATNASNVTGGNLSGLLTGTRSASATAINLASNDNYLSARVIQNSNTSGGFADGMFIGYANGNSGLTRIYGGGSTSPNVQIDGSGNLTASGNVTAFSDERLKKNWRHLSPNFVSKLANIKSGIYDRIDVNETQAGVSAQSLQTLLPEVIVKEENGMLSVNYGAAAMVACVELAKEVVKLKAEVDALKAKGQ